MKCTLSIYVQIQAKITAEPGFFFIEFSGEIVPPIPGQTVPPFSG
jgi:hypothetical protein